MLSSFDLIHPGLKNFNISDSSSIFGPNHQALNKTTTTTKRSRTFELYHVGPLDGNQGQLTEWSKRTGADESTFAKRIYRDDVGCVSNANEPEATSTSGHQ